MRKINFYYIAIAFSAIVMSMSSCTKNLEDDVDQLKKEVAENKSAIATLDQAMKNGMMITSVKPITGGFAITFSDNKTINIMNGTNGTNGTNGADGANGTNGTNGVDGFAPILSVDEQGYWTIVKVKGGAAERFTVGGKELKAVVDVPSIGENGNWFIGGVDTKLPSKGNVVHGKSPYINTVAENGVVGNWMIWDDAKAKFVDSGSASQGSGVDASIKVEDGYLWIGEEKTSIGNIPSLVYNELNNTITISINKDGKTVSYTLPTLSKIEDMIGTGGSISTISVPRGGKYSINISTATAPYTFTGGPFAGAITKDQSLAFARIPVLVNPSNVELDINEISIVDQKDVKYPVKVVATEYGATLTRAAQNNGLRTLIVAADGVLPIGATDLLAVKVMNGKSAISTSYDYEITSSPAVAVSVIAAATSKNKIGEPVVFAAPTSAIYTISSDQIYKSNIAIHADSKKYAEYLTITNNTVNAKPDAASIEALNGKTVKFIYTLIDYTGASQSYPNGVYDATKDVVVSIEFFSSVAKDSYDLSPVSHVLDATTVKFYSKLSELFDMLGDEKAAWKTNAKDFVVTITDDKDKAVTAITGLVVKEDNSTVTTGADAAKIQFIVDNTKLMPGTYKAVLTYKDGRNENAQTFKVNVPITITNPITLVERNTIYFTGDNVNAYGDDEANPTTNTFDLASLYVLNSAVVTFEEVSENPTADLITAGKMKISTATLNKPYKIKASFTYFGNSENKGSEIIIVTPKSAIKGGSITPQKDSKFELTVNDAKVTEVLLSKSFVVKDAASKDVPTFAAVKDTRIKSVTVTTTGANSGLLNITEDAGDFKVTLGTISAELAKTGAEVDVVITIKDQYDEILTKTVKFAIKVPKI